MKPVLPPTQTRSGILRIKGHVRGYVSGMVDADFDGILSGEINASVSTEAEEVEQTYD